MDNSSASAFEEAAPQLLPRIPALWIGLALLLGVGVLSSHTLGTQPGWTLAVVVCMAWLWITEPVPLWVTGLVPLVAFPFCAGTSLKQLLFQYIDPINVLFLGGMWIAKAMEEWHLHKRIALSVVAGVGTKPRSIVLGFMLATAVVSMFISNTAAAVMMAPIATAVILKLQSHIGERDTRVRVLAAAIMLGVGYAASIGGVGTKIGTGTNLVFVKQASKTLGVDVSFVSWLIVGVPMVIVCIPVAWWYLVRFSGNVPREDIAGLAEVIRSARREQPRMSRGELIAAIAFVGAAIAWITRSDIDLGSFVVRGWSGLLPFSWEELLGVPLSQLPKPLAELLSPRGAEAMVALLFALPLFLLRAAPKQPVLSLRAASQISWGLLMVLGGGFAMAYAITESGLSKLIGQGLSGVGHLHPLVLTIIACFTCTALSEVASNTATASILLPIVASSAENLGGDPKTLMFSVTIAASFGFMLPAGTPPNAVVFASGFVPVRTMVRSGIAIDLIGVLIVSLLSYVLVPFAFR